MFELTRADAVTFLLSLKDESLDLVITDPAYESLEKHRAKGTTTRLKVSAASSNEWFPIFSNARFPEFLKQVYRVLKKDTHFYMYCDQETMFHVVPLAREAGFTFWKPLVWDKVSIGMGYHYRCRYEFILFFEKGKRRLNSLAVGDIITCPRIRGGYPTQKPVDVSKVLVEQSSSPGEIVCDPFMGSGSVGIAAVEAKRIFVGCDIAEASLKLAQERLEMATGGQRAFA